MMTDTTKNLEKREGFLNRHVVGLPKQKAVIKIVTKDIDGEHIDLCEWSPFDPNNYKGATLPGKDFLGTAKVIEGKFPGIGIGFHAWECNNSEFIYYSLITGK